MRTSSGRGVLQWIAAISLHRDHGGDGIGCDRKHYETAITFPSWLHRYPTIAFGSLLDDGVVLVQRLHHRIG